MRLRSKPQLPIDRIIIWNYEFYLKIGSAGYLKNMFGDTCTDFNGVSFLRLLLYWNNGFVTRNTEKHGNSVAKFFWDLFKIQSSLLWIWIKEINSHRISLRAFFMPSDGPSPKLRWSRFFPSSKKRSGMLHNFMVFGMDEIKNRLARSG